MDHVERGFQLGKLRALAPTGNIGEGVVCGVNAKMLAHNIGDAFGLHLFAPFFCWCWYCQQILRLVQLRMGNLMHQGFDCLYLAHSGLDNDSVLHKARVALCAPLKILLHNRQGR